MKELEKDMTPRLIEDLGILRRGNNKGAYRYGLYECQYCGNPWEVITTRVNKGQSKSCGCVNFRITHGLTHHPLYGTWASMVKRCTKPKAWDYKHYGARGITVCEEWLDVTNFISWAEETHPNKAGYTLDRRNNELGYSPDNCHWVDMKTQALNKRIGKNNTSGYVGVMPNIKKNRWVANIGVNGKQVRIGSFKDKMDAVQARDNYIIENGLPHKLSGLIKN